MTPFDRMDLMFVNSRQWHRSVVRYWVRVKLGQAIKLFQAPRKISVLPSIFDTNLSSLMT